MSAPTLTAADVREALLRLAAHPDFPGYVADRRYPLETIGIAVMDFADSAARERAACAAEARAEGDR